MTFEYFCVSLLIILTAGMASVILWCAFKEVVRWIIDDEQYSKNTATQGLSTRISNLEDTVWKLQHPDPVYVPAAAADITYTWSTTTAEAPPLVKRRKRKPRAKRKGT